MRSCVPEINYPLKTPHRVMQEKYHHDLQLWGRRNTRVSRYHGLRLCCKNSIIANILSGIDTGCLQVVGKMKLKLKFEGFLCFRKSDNESYWSFSQTQKVTIIEIRYGDLCLSVQHFTNWAFLTFQANLRF